MDTKRYESAKLDFETIGKRIRERRKSLGYGNSDAFASEYGLAKSSIDKWETAQSHINVENLFKLCKIFNCDIEYLLGLQAEPTREVSDIEELTSLTPDAIRILMNKDAEPTAWIRKAFADHIIRHFVDVEYVREIGEKTAIDEYLKRRYDSKARDQLEQIYQETLKRFKNDESQETYQPDRYIDFTTPKEDFTPDFIDCGLSQGKDFEDDADLICHYFKLRQKRDFINYSLANNFLETVNKLAEIYKENFMEGVLNTLCEADDVEEEPIPKSIEEIKEKHLREEKAEEESHKTQEDIIYESAERVIQELLSTMNERRKTEEADFTYDNIKKIHKSEDGEEK